MTKSFMLPRATYRIGPFNDRAASVPKLDGSGRAIGPSWPGPALESIKAGKAYYGEVPILGAAYITELGHSTIRQRAFRNSTERTSDWTVLAGPALYSIKAGKAYDGEVPILGAPYITGYEPIKDRSGAEIGVYYVGSRSN